MLGEQGLFSVWIIGPGVAPKGVNRQVGMPYITHGFLRADSRNSMGFILLYGKKNVSRYGFRHSVLEATRRPVCHVILQRCARQGICWTMPLPRPSWPRRMNC